MTAWLLAIVATVVPLLYYVYRTVGLLRLGLQVGMNDSSFAAETFLKLLKDAERTMLICDDGNSMTDSIYDRKDVADQVLDCLKANPRLRIMCLFFSNDDTVFTGMLDGHAQVTMKRGGSLGGSPGVTSTSRSSTTAGRATCRRTRSGRPRGGIGSTTARGSRRPFVTPPWDTTSAR